MLIWLPSNIDQSSQSFNLAHIESIISWQPSRFIHWLEDFWFRRCCDLELSFEFRATPWFRRDTILIVPHQNQEKLKLLLKHLFSLCLWVLGDFKRPIYQMFIGLQRSAESVWEAFFVMAFIIWSEGSLKPSSIHVKGQEFESRCQSNFLIFSSYI